MARLCTFDGCDKLKKAKGLCAGHYEQRRRGKPLTSLQERVKRDGCEAEGCRRQHAAHGFCDVHLHRLKRHGSIDLPAGRAHPPGEAERWVRTIAVNWSDHACLLYPFPLQLGYGVFHLDGKRWRAHRYVLELLGRLDHTPGMQVRHLCGNPACCNPLHLKSGTPAENAADKLRHGTHRTTLAEAQVIEILDSSENSIDAAKRYGVSSGLIRAIRRREAWKHVPDPREVAK